MHRLRVVSVQAQYERREGGDGAGHAREEGGSAVRVSRPLERHRRLAAHLRPLSGKRRIRERPGFGGAHAAHVDAGGQKAPVRLPANEFRAASAQIHEDHVVGKLQGGAGEGERRLHLPRGHTGGDTERSTQSLNEGRSVRGVARRAGADEGDGHRAERPGLPHESLDGRRGPCHGRFLQRPALPQPLAQPGHRRAAHDGDGRHVLVGAIEIGHEQTHGVGAHVDGGATVARLRPAAPSIRTPQRSQRSDEGPRKHVSLAGAQPTGLVGQHRGHVRMEAGGYCPGRRAHRCPPPTPPRRPSARARRPRSGRLPPRVSACADTGWPGTRTLRPDRLAPVRAAPPPHRPPRRRSRGPPPWDR